MDKKTSVKIIPIEGRYISTKTASVLLDTTQSTIIKWFDAGKFDGFDSNEGDEPEPGKRRRNRHIHINYNSLMAFITGCKANRETRLTIKPDSGKIRPVTGSEEGRLR